MIFFTLPAFTQNKPVLSIDFNDRLHDTVEETQPGFQSFVMDGGGAKMPLSDPTIRHFGKLTVKVEGTGEFIYDDRWRAGPMNNGAFTQSALLRDFIFAKTNTGLQVTIGGLATNAPYDVSIWSFDIGSKGMRVSRWFANRELVANDHTFSGDVLPKTDIECRLDFRAISNAAGEIVLNGETEPQSTSEKGRADFGVFLNGLQLWRVKNESEENGVTK